MYVMEIYSNKFQCVMTNLLIITQNTEFSLYEAV